MNWDYIKRNKNNWYNKPGMAGHYWAIETFDLANLIVKDPKLNKTKLQKFIIKNSFRFDKDVDWHYFVNHLSKKYIAHVKHMLKRLNKKNILDELIWLENRTGVLRTPLEKTLRYLAFKFDKDRYLDYASKGYQWYGMKSTEGKERALDVVKLMEKDLNVKWR